MRKKILGVVMAAAMVASLAGCGASNNDSSSGSTETTSSKDITAEQYADTLKADAESYKQYITLPEYKGIEVTVDRSALEVTDESIETKIQSILSQYATTEDVTEGVTASGDVVTLDYSGLLDGTAFSGGTATDASYTIGSGKFITDLDQGLIGLTVGQEYSIPCTFPADYSSSTLAGQNVEFVVTVHSIQKSTTPELTDSFVAEHAADLEIDATDVAGLRSAVKASLEADAQITFASTKYQSIWTAISDKITPSDYPQEELDTLTSTLKNNIQSEYNQYGSYYGITDFNTYLSSVYGFETEDSFNEYAVEYAKTYLKEKMAITLIASNENISVSADEINDMGEELATYYGYDDYADILSTYGNEMNSEVGYEVLYQKIQDFLNENAVEA